MPGFTRVSTRRVESLRLALVAPLTVLALAACGDGGSEEDPGNGINGNNGGNGGSCEGLPRCDGDTLRFCDDAGRPASQSCSFGCEADACRAPACEAGESRCDGDTRELCAAGGARFVTVEVCAEGCRDGACLSCAPGDARCEGDRRQVCDDDGTGFDAGEMCENGCRDGACRVCAADFAGCEGDDRTVCAADGSGAEVAETCELGCDSGLCRICMPGSTRCANDRLEQCREDGLVWVQGEACENGCAAGRCRVCAADFIDCEGDDRLVCAEDGSETEVAETCEHGCDEGRCSGAACNPEDRRCDGDVREGCAENRRGFEALETCAFGCEAGACLDAVCEAGSGRCDGDLHLTCAADRRSYEEAGDCEFGCGEGACLEAACEIGELRCEGITPELCAEDRRRFTPQEDCGHSCAEGICVAPSMLACVAEPPTDCTAPVVAQLGRVAVGGEERVEIRLSNTGDFLMFVTALRLEGPHADSFAPARIPDIPFVIAQSESRTLRYIFSPTAIEVQQATLTVVSDDPEQAEHTLTLTGEGIAAPVLQIGQLGAGGAMVPFNDGDTLIYNRGLQGLGDVYPSFSVTGLNLVGTLRFEMFNDGTAWITTSDRQVSFATGVGADGRLLRARYTVTGEANLNLLEGAAVTLRATFTDDLGFSASDEVDVLLDVDDFP